MMSHSPARCVLLTKTSLRTGHRLRSCDHLLIICQWLLIFQNIRCDSRGVLGWEAVDDLAKYLVQLNRTITALSVVETDEIVRLYSKLHQMDKQPTTYSLKSKKKTLPGPWRASRKQSGSAPGQQAAER